MPQPARKTTDSAPDATQVCALVPTPLYEKIKRDAELAGVPMSVVVRWRLQSGRSLPSVDAA